jgi:hypothetical protein
MAKKMLNNIDESLWEEFKRVAKSKGYTVGGAITRMIKSFIDSEKKRV